MDSEDRRILELLKEDSKRPVREIAEKLRMRPSTVHQRILKMVRDGVIERFTVKLDDERVGEDFIAFMFVKTSPSTRLGNDVLRDGHVKEVFGLTGEYDLLLKMKFRGVKEFNDFVLDFRKDQKVVSTLTMVATAKVKEDI